MSSPFSFYSFHLYNAITTQALPALERLAANPALRERALRRFDRDEPPPYFSSTDEEPDWVLLPPPVTDEMREEMTQLFEEPLTDNELEFLVSDDFYKPSWRWAQEVHAEKNRIKRWSLGLDKDTRDYLYQERPAKRGYAGHERVDIIARHNIKRRWQKLGIWNPEWGIPGRGDPQPNDETSSWRWQWQRRDLFPYKTNWETLESSLNPEHAVAQAVLSRKGLRWGEYVLAAPHSHLEGDVEASYADSFITSRPWYAYAAEIEEKKRRRANLPPWLWRTCDLTKKKTVQDLWVERGTWKPDWREPGKKTSLVGWKWRHESPSPEPEDLSGHVNLDTFELTPSEADALEAIPPPTPKSQQYYRPIIGHLDDFPDPPAELDDGPCLFGMKALAPTADTAISLVGPDPSASPPTPSEVPEHQALARLRNRRRRRTQRSDQLPEEAARAPRRGERLAAVPVPAPPLRRSARLAAKSAKCPVSPLGSKPSTRLERRTRNNFT